MEKYLGLVAEIVMNNKEFWLLLVECLDQIIQAIEERKDEE